MSIPARATISPQQFSLCDKEYFKDGKRWVLKKAVKP